MRLVLTLACAALAGAAHAAPLTFEAALDLAGRTAPSLAARDAEADAARAAAIAAGRLPDPKLTLGLGNFPISGPPAGSFSEESMTMATVGVMQEVPNSAKRRASRERASADIEAADAARRVESRNVRLSAALAWIDLYYAERRLAALGEIERALAPLRASAPARLASGSARPAQTLEAEQLTAALGDRRAELVAAAGKARAELARWTSDPGPAATGAAPSYKVDGEALRAGLEAHPSLRAYEAAGRQAEAEVAAAKANKRPDWAWDVAYQRRDPIWGDMVSAGVTVSLPLFARTRQDPVIAARTASASRVRYEREAERRALAAALDSDLAAHAMHHDRSVRARMTLEPLAARRAELETASYAAGTAGLSDVLAAMLALAETKLDILDRDADVQRDAVRIVLTYGSDTP